MLGVGWMKGLEEFERQFKLLQPGNATKCLLSQNRNWNELLHPIVVKLSHEGRRSQCAVVWDAHVVGPQQVTQCRTFASTVHAHNITVQIPDRQIRSLHGEENLVSLIVRQCGQMAPPRLVGSHWRTRATSTSSEKYNLGIDDGKASALPLLREPADATIQLSLQCNRLII